MSYDVTVDVAQLQEHLRSAKAERDANWAELDRLRSRLREIVPDVPEGGDLVAAVRSLLAARSGEPAPDATAPAYDPATRGCQVCGEKGWPHYDRLASGIWICAECHHAIRTHYSAPRDHPATKIDGVGCPACGAGIVLATCDNPSCRETWIGERAGKALDARHDAGKCPPGACARCAPPALICPVGEHDYCLRKGRWVCTRCGSETTTVPAPPRSEAPPDARARTRFTQGEWDASREALRVLEVLGNSDPESVGLGKIDGLATPEAIRRAAARLRAEMAPPPDATPVRVGAYWPIEMLEHLRSLMLMDAERRHGTMNDERLNVVSWLARLDEEIRRERRNQAAASSGDACYNALGYCTTHRQPIGKCRGPRSEAGRETPSVSLQAAALGIRSPFTVELRPTTAHPEDRGGNETRIAAGRATTGTPCTWNPADTCPLPEDVNVDCSTDCPGPTPAATAERKP